MIQNKIHTHIPKKKKKRNKPATKEIKTEIDKECYSWLMGAEKE